MATPVRIATVIFAHDAEALRQMSQADGIEPDPLLRNCVRQEAIQRGLLLPGPADALTSETFVEDESNPTEYSLEALLDPIRSEGVRLVLSGDSPAFFKMEWDQVAAKDEKEKRSVRRRFAKLIRRPVEADEPARDDGPMERVHATLSMAEWNAMITMSEADCREKRDELRYFLRLEAIRRGLRTPDPASELQTQATQAATP